MSVKNAERLEQMLAMRFAGWNLDQIGTNFNLTRERVRQLVGHIKRPRKWPRTYFRRVMRQWLWDAGYRRCPCGTWDRKVTESTRHCPECNRRCTREYFRTEHGKQKHRDWQHNNPQKMREYQAKWRDKNPERLRKYRQGQWEKHRRTHPPAVMRCDQGPDTRDPKLPDLRRAIQSMLKRTDGRAAVIFEREKIQ